MGVLREVVEVATAEDPVPGARGRHRVWPVGGLRVIKVPVINILTPLEDIPMHVVKAERVRLLATHGVMAETEIDALPPHVIQNAVTGESTRGPRPTGVLPLRLTR